MRILGRILTIKMMLFSVTQWTMYRNVHGGGVAMYIQNQIPTKVRYDLMFADIEVLWIQINSPPLKPLLIGCG